MDKYIFDTAKRARRFTLWGGFDGKYADAPRKAKAAYHCWHSRRIRAWCEEVGERYTGRAFAKFGEDTFDAWLAQHPHP